MFVDVLHKRFRQREILFFPQEMPLEGAAHCFQRSGVFGKRRRRQKGFLGLFGQHQPEDQVCRTVAAEDLFCRNALRFGKLRPEFPAKRIRVTVGGRQGRGDGICHPLGQPQRADIGGKIQCIPPELRPVSCPVAAVYQQFHPNFSFRTLSVCFVDSSPEGRAKTCLSL